MSEMDEPGDDFGRQPPPSHAQRQTSSWLWPALLGGGLVVVAVLAVLVVLQLTDDTDSASPAPIADAASTGSTAPESTAPADPEQGDGEDGPVDRSCDDYTNNESLPVQLCDGGDLVAEIQFALTEAGFSVDVDGFFGPGTEIAVLEFQTAQGLAQDGIVGPDTYAALPSVLIEPD